MITETLLQILRAANEELSVKLTHVNLEQFQRLLIEICRMIFEGK